MTARKVSVSPGNWQRLLTVPRLMADESAEQGDETAAHLTGVVAAAHAGESIELLVATHGGARKVTWCTRSTRAIGGIFPPGSECSSVDTSSVQELCDQFEWASASLGIHDVAATTPSAGAALERLVLHGGPLAWLVRATPVALDTTDEPKRLARLVAQGDRGTVAERLRAERASRVLEVLERDALFGLWNLTLCAGAPTIREARVALARLTSIARLAGLAYTVSTSEPTAPLVTSDAVAVWARPPLIEVPGVRVARTATWDFTPEQRGPVAVGAVMEPTDERPRGTLSVPLDTLNRHVFVTGATGSGKSNTVRVLLEQLTAEGVPWLVIEPAKAEYQTMANRVDAPVSVIRLGSPEARGVALNPLAPTSVGPPGARRTFNLATHIALVRSLFEAAFEAEEPFPQILAMALDSAYRAAGWNPITGGPVGQPLPDDWYPTLGDLRSHAMVIVDEIGYGREVRDNVRGFVDVRINGLRQGAAGGFLEGGKSLDLERVAGTNLVLQIEDLGNERDQAFVIGAVLVRWVELLRLLGDSRGVLRHVLVIEEAHRLLREGDGPARRAIEQFANLLAEVRSYGQGVMVAEQIPSKLIVDVIKNSALKVVHRLPAKDDRDTVGATMNLTESQSEAVVSLRPGRAVVHADGMDRAIPVSVPRAGGGGRSTGAADPAVGRRGAGCPDRCSSGAGCTTEVLDVALPFASAPDVAAWVDLAVVARLLGEAVPLPDAGTVERWRSDLRKRDLLRCALGDACTRSVRARAVPIGDAYPPADLARTLADELAAWVVDGVVPAAAPQWQVAEFRWRDVYLRLLSAQAAGAQRAPDALRHEAATRGLTLPDDALAEQIAWLEGRQYASAVAPTALLYGSPSVLRSALVGARVASVVELAHTIGCRVEWIGARFGDAEQQEGN